MSFPKESGSDVKSLTSLVPYIIRDGDREMACRVIFETAANYTDSGSWLPEVMTLFNTPGIDGQKKSAIVKTIVPGTIPESQIEAFFSCSARIGALGFSFPEWRYLTQGSDQGPSMVENYGMQRLQRETDRLTSNPARDLYGTGFIKMDDDWYIEYRRAYIVCSHYSQHDPATVIIRNNSYFFGRDRLPQPVYVSWNSLQPQMLQAITPDKFLDPDQFIKWQNVASTALEIALPEKMRRIQALLSRIDNFEADFNLWLRTPAIDHGGLNNLSALLKSKVPQAGETTGPTYIGEIASHLPPWFPKRTLPLTPDFLAQLEADKEKRIFTPEEKTKLVLLSNAEGDFPVPFKKDFDFRRPDRLPAHTPAL